MGEGEGEGEGEGDGQCTLETEAINCEECEKIAEAVAFCASDTFDKGQNQSRSRSNPSSISALSQLWICSSALKCSYKILIRIK